MKFLCGSCRTKYQISDEKVRGKILTIRCKKCGAKVMVKESLQRQASIAVAPVADEDAKAEAPAKVAMGGSAAASASAQSLSSAFDVAMGGALDDMPTSIAPTPANEADAGVEWYVAVDGSQQGPFAYAELVARIKTKDFVGRHYVWHDGFDNWKRVRDVPDLAQYIAPDPKKKPPPPPPAAAEAPPAEGKVVDFAQKRAERDRKGRESISPDQVEALTSDPPTAQAAAVPASKNERAEQLDNVLNEALGIGGEGQTAKSEAKKTDRAAGAALAQGANLANEAFTSERSDSFFPEDIFDAVPRASQQEIVARENTRFFVQAAGVNSQKSKNKMGLVAIGSGIAVVLGFVGLVLAGVIQINIPGIGSLQFKSAEETPDDAAMADLSADEKKALEGLSGAEKKARIQKVRSARKPKSANPGKPLEYVNNGPEGSADPGGSRGVDAKPDSLDIGKFNSGGPGSTGPIGSGDLPGSNPTVPPVDSGKLDEGALRRVINDNKTAVASCYQRELRGGSDLKGRIDFLVTVAPAGSVSRVSINTPQFRQTALAQCIADKIKDWRFPSFQGAEVQVIVPFVLARASY